MQAAQQTHCMASLSTLARKRSPAKAMKRTLHRTQAQVITSCRASCATVCWGAAPACSAVLLQLLLAPKLTRHLQGAAQLYMPPYVCQLCSKAEPRSCHVVSPVPSASSKLAGPARQARLICCTKLTTAGRCSPLHHASCNAALTHQAPAAISPRTLSRPNTLHSCCFISFSTGGAQSASAVACDAVSKRQPVHTVGVYSSRRFNTSTVLGGRGLPSCLPSILLC